MPDNGIAEIRKRICQRDALEFFLIDQLNSLSSQKDKIWVISGDLDGLKRLNDIYGKRIIDVMLAWIYQEIFQVLTLLLPNNFKLTIMGDDIIIVLGSSQLSRSEVLDLLKNIKRAVENLQDKFAVGCLENFSQVLKQLSPQEIHDLDLTLRKKGIYFDRDQRAKGHLCLVYLGNTPVSVKRGFANALKTIKSYLPPTHDGFDITEEWLCDKSNSIFLILNNSLAITPTISAGAVCHHQIMKELKLLPSQFNPRRIKRVATAMFHRAQDCLSYIKGNGGNHTHVGESPKHIHRKKPAPKLKISPKGQRYLIPILTEQELRIKVYELCQQEKVGTLLKFEPFYSSDICNLSEEEKIKFRGNRYGFGLKGVNEFFGHKIGDKLIKLLGLTMSDVLDEISSKLPGKKQILIGRFIDRFYIYIVSQTLETRRTVDLATEIIQELNQQIAGLEIAHLKITRIYNQPGLDGGKLFNYLSLTELAPEDICLVFADRMVTIKVHCESVNSKGLEIIEERAFQNALEITSNIKTASN